MGVEEGGRPAGRALDAANLPLLGGRSPPPAAASALRDLRSVRRADSPVLSQRRNQSLSLSQGDPKEDAINRSAQSH